MDTSREVCLPVEESRRKKCCGCRVLYFRLAASILALIFLTMGIASAVFYASYWTVGLGILSAVCFVLICGSFMDYQSGWENCLGFIRNFTSRFSTGLADVPTEQEPGEPQRNRTRRLRETALDLFRLCRRQDTRADSTIDISTRRPENVGSAPEYDAANARTLSVSNRDESRSQTTQRLADSEHIQPLNPPYTTLKSSEQHRNPLRPIDMAIARILAPVFKREANTEELNSNLTSNESESSSPIEISTPQTPLSGPSGLQWRRDEESNETRLGPNETVAEIHHHSQSVSSELDLENLQLTPEQIHSPIIRRGRLPSTQQQVMIENLPGQVEQTEDPAAVSHRIHRRASLDDSCQVDQNVQTSEESPN